MVIIFLVPTTADRQLGIFIFSGFVTSHSSSLPSSLSLNHNDIKQNTMMMAMLLPPPIQTTLLLLILLLTGYAPAESIAFNLYRYTVRCHCPSSSRQHRILSSPTKQQHIIRHNMPVASAISAEANHITNEQKDAPSNLQSSSSSSSEKLCYYKRIDGSWKPRKELKDLKIGERLFATRLPDRSVLCGVTSVLFTHNYLIGCIIIGFALILGISWRGRQVRKVCG
jgi:hypothetical protein